jgi:hypothetical protein
LTKQILLLGLLLILAATLLPAQSSSIDFKMSTSFIADNTRLPAGSYRIQRLSEDGMMELSSVNGEPSVLLSGEPLETKAGTSNVHFAKYDKKLFLKQIDFPSGDSYWLATSGEERALRKSGAKPTKVTVKPAK